MSPLAISIADIDGDGLNDVVVAGGAAGGAAYGVLGKEKLSWFKNSESNTYRNQFILSTDKIACNEVHCSDLDNDGDIDIMFSNYGYSPGVPPWGGEVSNTALIWLENNGEGIFTQNHVILEGDWYINFFLFDVNNDGFDDVILSRAINNQNSEPVLISYMINNTEGGFDAPIVISNDPQKTVHSVHDFNNDGINDFVLTRRYSVGNDSVYIAFGQADSTFIEEVKFGGVFLLDPPLIVDVNNDGMLDFMYCDEGVKVRLGLSGAIFSDEFTFFEVTNPFGAIVFEDLNFDGNRDLLIATEGFMYLYILSENFDILSSDTLKISSNRTMALNRLSGSEHYHIHYFQKLHHRNNFTFIANDTLVNSISMTNDFAGKQIDQFVDVDNDGLDDIVFFGGWYKNEDDGIFYPSNTFSFLQTNTNFNTFYERQNLILTDLNLDGQLDLIYRTDTNSIGFALGLNALTFNEHRDIDTTINESDNLFKNLLNIKLFDNVDENFLILQTEKGIKLYKYLIGLNAFELINTFDEEGLKLLKAVDINYDGNIDFFGYKTSSNEFIFYIIPVQDVL